MPSPAFHKFVVKVQAQNTYVALPCETTSSKDYAKFESQVFSNYCTSDIRTAEKALLDGLQNISRYENTEGIDIDLAKGLLHQRLFLIYRSTHETNKMVFEFQQSMEGVARSDHKRGISRPPPAISYEEFAKKLDWRERGANVRWKTNIFNDGHQSESRSKLHLRGQVANDLD